MNFNRFQCQEFIETELGCTDYTQLSSYKHIFKDYSLRETKLDELRGKAKADAKDLYFKALITFLEATNGIKRGQSSWPIVKLYYSLFYSLRVFLLLSGNVILKNGTRDIYGLKISAGEKPEKLNCTGISGDHKVTIKYFKELFSHSEKINTNNIDGQHVFDWIMSYRELVNYRINSFIEPQFGYEVVPNLFIATSSYDDLVSRYLNHPDIIYCFLKDHSIYATPLLFLKKSHDFLKENYGDEDILSEERCAASKSVIEQMDLKDSKVLKNLIFEL
ncbi:MULTISPECIES: hypothetical protein [Rahnella]|uniref:Uncharacterized protein n=1 Tax=Rahnella laticis TaxID=2787622 RepID=A0ABS0EDG5_9GAMM|nr:MULTISPECIES: hypothetical protein [Rahnella]MBF7982864.1 hypothetical protein [Rahnella laticis]MBF8002799.1 hypothetical protein [Rahnella sp. LAC-M12]